MKYVTPVAMILSMPDQDIMTLSFQQEGYAADDVIHFGDLINMQ